MGARKDMAETKFPLSGIVVLDLTRVRSGPTAVRQLADYGADVIKIEEPDAKDSENSAFDRRLGSDFQNLQRNKRSMTLNLKAPEGLAIFKRLVDKADVVVENYRPGVKHRLGIDYESLRKVNPRLIYASISGFGEEGPYRDRPGIDQVVQGMGGLMSITGLPGQGPVRAGIAVTDLSAGLFLSYGIVLALFERERSGEGQYRTRYEAENHADVERYMDEYAAALRADFAAHFAEGVRVSRAQWIELARWDDSA